MDISTCWEQKGGITPGGRITPGTADPVKLQALECIIIQILNLAMQFAGIAVFIMFIIGGFKYLTAGGDAKKTEAAQKTITSAILGLALLLGSWLIMLLLEQIVGFKLTEFKLFD